MMSLLSEPLASLKKECAKLTEMECGFFRDYLLNTNFTVLAQRYFMAPDREQDIEVDAFLIELTARRLGERLALVAQQLDKADCARRLALPIEPQDQNSVLFSLALQKFRIEHTSKETLTEKELLTLFQQELRKRPCTVETHHPSLMLQRAKQLAAFIELEPHILAEPKLHNSVKIWITPTVANRLHDAEIVTLRDLVDTINGYGYRWYTRVPKVGEMAAAHLTRWLSMPDVARSLGVNLHVRALTKASNVDRNVPAAYTPRMAIVPLENFLPPEHLDGRQGTNRGTRSRISANNDLDAIREWLSQWPSDSSTYRGFRNEAERFLLWSVLERGKPMSSLDTEDCHDYRDFLSMLGTANSGNGTDAMIMQRWHARFCIPQAEWINKRRGTPRWSPLWRPFNGQLSSSTQSTALATLKSLMQWLERQHYLDTNPMVAVAKTTLPPYQINPDRSFTEEQWQAVMSYLASTQPKATEQIGSHLQTARYLRMRFILALAYGTGMRLAELVALRRAHFRSVTDEAKNTIFWLAEFPGRSEKMRKVYFEQDLMDEMNEYFVHRSHSSFYSAPYSTPVIASLPRYEQDSDDPVADSFDQPLSEARLSQLIKEFFVEVADAIEKSNPAVAHVIRSASTHWLRHTYAMHALNAGVHWVVISRRLGHETVESMLPLVNKHRRANKLAPFK